MAKYKILYIPLSEFIIYREYLWDEPLNIWSSKLKAYNNLITIINKYNDNLYDYKAIHTDTPIDNVSGGYPLTIKEFEIVKVEGNKKRKL